MVQNSRRHSPSPITLTIGCKEFDEIVHWDKYFHPRTFQTIECKCRCIFRTDNRDGMEIPSALWHSQDRRQKVAFSAYVVIYHSKSLTLLMKYIFTTRAESTIQQTQNFLKLVIKRQRLSLSNSYDRRTSLQQLIRSLPLRRG